MSTKILWHRPRTQPESLIEFDDAESMVTTLISPANSIAGLFGFVVLGLLLTYRKFFS